MIVALILVPVSVAALVLFMAAATTLIGPLFLKMLFASERAAHDQIDSPDAGGIVVRDGLSRIGSAMAGRGPSE